ncbi:MAG: alpha/beta hydrolase [Solirubrobacterales bacterium]|nr:alpha/beta hydrolase [Solirubrobacterales bacterium]
MAERFLVPVDGAELAGEDTGPGAGATPPVVLLHGLTATRRYVVMGSRLLEREGHRVISYDARGHGESGWGVERCDYTLLADDLARVMDARGVERAVLAGASMGAHTLLNFALNQPDRAAGLVVITPAYDGRLGDLERWARLAAGLRAGGIDGFVEAYNLAAVDPQLRDTVEKVIRQRMAKHRDLGAMVSALEQIPSSRPFGALDDLAGLNVACTVIASSDRADPEHPQQVGESYAARIPGAQLRLDEPGKSPVAWQGSQVARVIAELLARVSAG